MRCVICSAELSGRQIKFCSEECSDKHQAERWRMREGRTKHPCSDCGKPCGRQARRCPACSQRAQKGVPFEQRRLHKPGLVRESIKVERPEIRRRYRLWTEIRERFIPNCSFCEAELQKREWRGTAYYRCPGCGLETTPMEIRRIQVWEAA